MNANKFNERLKKIPLPSSLDHKWQEHQKSFRYHAKHEGVDQFLKWSTIQATMFVGNNKHTQHKFDQLDEKWLSHIDDPGVGKPTMFNDKTSGNYIEQAYHLSQLEKYMNLSDIKSVIEFGGGYGAMRVVWNRAFGDDVYYMYDLPEFILLQEYYISKVIDAKTEYRTAKDKSPADLCIAMFSLSETPIEQRNKFLDENPCDKYFIGFQSKFFDINNHKYFENWAQQLSWHQVIRGVITTHWYLIGER